MMKPGCFILEGYNSEEIGMFIQDRPQLKAPKRKGKRLEPYGYSGVIDIDEDAYEDSEMELILWVDGKSDKEASWKREKIFYMFNSGKYLEFIPYWDPNKIHKVKVAEPLLFTPKYWHRGGQPFSLKLFVAPYKTYTDSHDIELTSAGNIVNTTLDISEPIVKVFGSGSIDLIVNSKPFKMKNVTGDITLDSHACYAYRIHSNGVIENENDKIFSREYPIFLPGNNTISWNRGVTKLEIDPRWQTLI